MKSFLFKMGALVLPAVFLFSCEGGERLDSQPVQFTFSFTPGENKGGRITPVNLPEGVSLLISLEMNNGEVVLDQHQIALHKVGERYVSAPVKLSNNASYNITDFIIVSDSLEVLYATPRKGSPMSSEISRALPYSFMSDERTRSDLSIEVLDARMKSAKSFGYNSFRRNKHPLKLEVFIPIGNRIQRTTAEALIMKGLDTLKVYRLSAKMNTLTFNGDPEETYTLVVVKDSYSRFSHDFTMRDLRKKLKHKPLKILLEPALSVVAVPTQDQNYFGMQFDTWYAHEFKVDWGDGTNEIWRTGVTVVLDHYYQEPGKYFISITGSALDSVLNIGDFSGGGEIERLGMHHLTNLFDFRLESSQGPKVIDFSHNTFLSEIRIYSAGVKDLIIPNNARIYLLELVGCTKLKKESLDEVINDLHHQVVNNSRYNGDFIYHLADNYELPILVPSPEALEKLRDLKHTYQWLVVPDPDL